MFITATEANVQDGRQAQGLVRQRMEIQIGAKVLDGRHGQGQGQAEWSGAGRVVKRAGSGSGQARVKHLEGEKKRGWEKTGADRTNTGKLDKQDELATDKQRTQV
jgi:hypothetical protein